MISSTTIFRLDEIIDFIAFRIDCPGHYSPIDRLVAVAPILLMPYAAFHGHVREVTEDAGLVALLKSIDWV